MHRRNFLSAFSASACSVLSSHNVFAMGEDKDGNDYTASTKSATVVDTLAGRSLKEMREFHQREIDEEYLGFWNKHGIDWNGDGDFGDDGER